MQAVLWDVLESRALGVSIQSLVGTHTFIPLLEERGTAYVEGWWGRELHVEEWVDQMSLSNSRGFEGLEQGELPGDRSTWNDVCGGHCTFQLEEKTN